MKWGQALVTAPLLIFVALPLVALLHGSGVQDLRSVVDQPSIRDALWLTLRTSLIAVGLLVLFGLPVAWYLARSRSWISWWVSTLVELPAVLPPAVAGIGLLLAWGRFGLVGQYLPFAVPFTSTAVVMAQMFVAVPLVVGLAAAAFRSIDTHLLEAAQLDGAGWWLLGCRVIWPLARVSLLSGIGLGWARAVGEFGATLLFAGSFPGVTQTVSLAIYDAFSVDLQTAQALGVILLIVAALVLGVVRMFAQLSEKVG